MSSMLITLAVLVPAVASPIVAVRFSPLAVLMPVDRPVAKANGFDVKALRQIVKLRKIEPTEREEQDAILETYMHALGMLKA